MKQVANRAKSPGKKKLRGGQIVVPVNPLETHIYVNFTISGTTITSATSTDGRVTVGSIGTGTVALSVNSSLSTLKNYTLYAYNGTKWAEIPRANLDMGGTTVSLYGTTNDILIRKQQGLSGKISDNEILIPANIGTFGGVLNFTNLSQSMFGFAISGTPNAYIQLIFTSNYSTPNTKWTGWSPSSVPGLSLWLDAIEPGPNGFTPNIGIPVTSWQDKSGKNNHGSTSSAPIYQSNSGTTGTYKMGMYFNGSTSFFSGPMQNNTKYCCMFAVIGPDDGQSGSRVLSLGAPGVNDSTGTNAYASMSITTSGNATRYTTGNSSTVATSYTVNSTGNVPSIGTSWINNSSANVLVNGIIMAIFTGSIATAANMFTSTMTVTAVSTGIITIGMILSGTNIPLNTMVIGFGTGTGGLGTYTVTINNQINGSATTINSTTITGISTMPISTPTNPTLNMGSYSIGKNNSGGSFFRGYVHEILVYTQHLSKQARQTIEGYLAWKWGIALNTAHLYDATRQPNINTMHTPFPLALNNITPIMWLDGQDPLGNESSSFPTNFTKIMAWADKSGNNNHGVANSAFAPNYMGNGIVFNGTSSYNLNGTIVPKYPRITQRTITHSSPQNPSIDGLSGITIDSNGNMYVSIYETGSVSRNGNDLYGNIGAVAGVAVDSTGSIYITRRDRHIITRIDVGTGQWTNIAGSENSSGTSPEPWVANFTGSISNNVLTVTVMTSGTIAIGANLKTTSANTIIGVISSFGTGTGSTGTYNLTGGTNTSSNTLISFRLGGQVSGPNARFNIPYGITIDKNNIIYVTDWNHMIRRIELTGSDPKNPSNWSVSGVSGGWGGTTYGSTSSSNNAPVDGSCDTALFNYPLGITVDSTGRYLYVADKENRCVRKIDTVTRVVSSYLSLASVGNVYGIACDLYGIVYVSLYNSHIYMHNTDMNMAPVLFVSGASATGLTVYNDSLYYNVGTYGSNTIYSLQLARPTYLYSPLSIPLTNFIHGFIVSNVSGYNRNVSSMLSLGSYTGVETYTVNTQPSTSVVMEDSMSSSYIGLYNDNGNRDVFRNNIRIQTGVSDAPGNSATMPPSLIYFSSNNTTVTMRINGGTFTTATGTFSTFRIGAYGLGLQPANIRRIATFVNTNYPALMNYSFDGVIYEVIVYRDNLTPIQYQFLEAYLCWKWSIPLQDSTNPYFTSTTTPPNPPIAYTSELPNPIDKITFNTINPADFTIGWTGGDGATSYVYSINPSVGGQPSTNNGLTSKTAVFTSVNTTTTSYTITVTPKNNAGSATTATATLLRTPVVATVNTYTSTGFTVNITAVTGASSYVFYLNGIKSIPTSSTATAYTFTTLNGGKTYSVTYTAVSTTGHESKQSPPISVITKPSTPYSFILTRITPTSFTLTWSGGEGATSYSYSGITGQPSAGNDNGVISRSANFTGLSNMTTYNINVTAIGVNGSSDPGLAKILPAPDSATMIFSMPSTTGFSIGSFTPIPTATSYSIYLNNIKYSVTTSTSNIQITNQKPGSSISVYARSIIGDVEGWNSVSVRTVQLLATQPRDFIVTETTNSSFKLSWSGGDGATSYQYSLQPSTDNGVASKSAIFTGLFSSNTYTISVEAINTAGLSGPGTVTVLPAPTWSPTQSAKNITPTTVNITIFGNISSIPGVTGAESYNLYINGTLYVNSVSPTIPVTVLNRGANLTFTATALSNGVEGFRSVPFVVQLPPSTPTNLVLSEFVDNGFKVSWTGPSSPEATSYTYTVGPSRTPLSILVDNGLTSQSVTVTGLFPMNTYTVYITAFAGSTPSLDSGSINIPAGIELTSSNISSVTQTGLTINITTPAQTVAVATSYNLYINGALYTTSTTTIASTTIVVTGQISGSNLGLSVRAIVNGVEIWAGLSTEFRLAPSTPRNLVLSALTTTGFNLGWTGPVPPEASAYVYTISNTVGQAGVTPDPANITDMGINSNTATFWNLDSTKTYTITVQATRTPYVSGIATIVVPAATNLSASAITTTGFTLRIGRPVSSASSYNVYINGIATSLPATSQSSTTSISSETFIVTGQPGGSIVSVYVRAIVGGQEFWPSATLVVPLVPTPITDITPSEYNMNGFKLTWSGGVGATSYTYGIACSNAGWKTISPSGANDNGVASKFAIFTQLSFQNSYTITVSAVNVSGSSSAPITILNGPTNVSSSNLTATGFTLTINAAVTGATSYNIYINSGQTFTVGSYTLLQNTTSVGTGITVTDLPAESLTKLIITSKSGDIEGWPYNYFSTQISSTNGLTSTNGNSINSILDSTDNLYIPSDGTSSMSSGAIISKFSIHGGNITTFKSIDVNQSPYNSLLPPHTSSGKIIPLVFDPDGNLYGIFWGRICMLDITGNFSCITALQMPNQNTIYSVSGTQASSTPIRIMSSGTYDNIVIDSHRNLYVFCYNGLATGTISMNNNAICKIAYSGKNSAGVPQFGLLTLFAGTGLHKISLDSSASLDEKINYHNTYYNGDGGSALNANLIYIRDLSIDSSNNIYMTTWPFVIRKITPGGIITTVVGASSYLSSAGLVPLGANLSTAQVMDGSDIASLSNVVGKYIIDLTGNTFLIDTHGGCIYKISSAGIITLVYNSASFRISPDNFGNFYFSRNWTPGSPIYKLNPYFPIQLTVAPITLSPLQLSIISTSTTSISSTTGITISWTATGAITSYTYYGAGLPSTDNGLSSQMATFTGLTNTNTYTVTVTASKWGASVSQSITVPRAPAFTLRSEAFTKTYNSCTVNSFTAVTGATSYKIYSGNAPNGTLITTVTGSPNIISNLTPIGGYITLYIRAIVGGIEGFPSLPQYIQLPPADIVNDSAIINYTNSTTSFTVTWAGGDGCTSFTFSYSSNPTGAPQPTVNFLTKTATFNNVVSTASPYIFRLTLRNSAAIAYYNGLQNGFQLQTTRATTIRLDNIVNITKTGFRFSYENTGWQNNMSPSNAYYEKVYVNDINIGRLQINGAQFINITGQPAGSLLRIYTRGQQHPPTTEFWPSNTLFIQLKLIPGTGTDATLLQFAFDAGGTLYYISESLKLYKLANTGTICEPTYASTATLLAGAGSAINVGFNNPTAMIFDTAGNLYVADNNARNVFKFANSGSAAAPTFSGVSTFISTTNKANIQPWALTLDAGGNLYISDTNNQQILKVSKTGADLDAATLTTVVGSVGASSTNVANGDGGPALSATLYNVKSLMFDGNGNLYFTSELHKINIVYNTGTPTAPVFGNIDVLSFKPPGGNGNYSDIPAVDGATLSSTKFNRPTTAAFDKSGNLYVADLNGVIIANNTGTATAPIFETINVLYTANSLGIPLKQLGFNSAMALWFIDSAKNEFMNISTLSAPKNISASAFTSTGFTLKWLGADKASSYAYSPVATTDNGVASKSAVFTGLTAGVTTTVTITANCGANSAPASVTIPGAPSGLTSSAITSTGFTLTIGTPVAGATSYNVYINGSLYLIPASTTTSSPTTIVIGGQTASTTLSVTVSGIVGGVQGWLSAPLSVQLS